MIRLVDLHRVQAPPGPAGDQDHRRAPSAATGACRSPTATAAEAPHGGRRAAGSLRPDAGRAHARGASCSRCARLRLRRHAADQPIAHDTLERMVASPFPVYWLGARLSRAWQITEATHDPCGAYSVQYGDCLQGGQGTCVPPLRVVTSPDNSFLAGGQTPSRLAASAACARRRAARAARSSSPTGGVVVDIYGDDARLARAAAAAVVADQPAGRARRAAAGAPPDTGSAQRRCPRSCPRRSRRSVAGRAAT